MVGAGAVKVTVAVDGLPPRTVLGLSEMEAKLTGLIDRVPLWLEPPRVAEIGAVVAEVTVFVDTLNVVVD